MPVIVNTGQDKNILIELYPGYPNSITDKPNLNFFRDLESLLGYKAFPFSSARAALVFALKALGFTRMDEVLVPPFLSDCVISAISKTAFPTMVATPRTRGIYVFHQFGFPQEIKAIELKAKQEGWAIINCCVHSLFTKYKDEWIVGWGDFTIFSLPKMYPCGLGGGLITSNVKIKKALNEDYPKLFELHKKFGDQAYEILMNANQSPGEIDSQFNVESVYGYLPNTVTYPTASYKGLPSDIQSIIADIERRKDLISSAKNYLKKLKQGQNNDDVVPFALPLNISPKKIGIIKEYLKSHFNVRAEVLHFDYNQNILDARYEKSLALGCHSRWDNSIFENLELAKLWWSHRTGHLLGGC